MFEKTSSFWFYVIVTCLFEFPLNQSRICCNILFYTSPCMHLVFKYIWWSSFPFFPFFLNLILCPWTYLPKWNIYFEVYLYWKWEKKTTFYLCNIGYDCTLLHVLSSKTQLSQYLQGVLHHSHTLLDQNFNFSCFSFLSDVVLCDNSCY